MKANRQIALRLAAAAAASAQLLAISSCSDQRAMPKAAPTQASAPAPPAPRPLPQVRPPTKWADAPQTPGDWRWSMEGARSVARFGGDMLVLSCNRDAQLVTLIRSGAGEGQVPLTQVPLTIVTSSLIRPVSGEAQAGPPPSIAVAIPGRDGVLDAMAFSRGRFAIEAAGLPTLYLPSWPEVSRVVEDCR